MMFPLLASLRAELYASQLKEFGKLLPQGRKISIPDT